MRLSRLGEGEGGGGEEGRQRIIEPSSFHPDLSVQTEFSRPARRLAERCSGNLKRYHRFKPVVERHCLTHAAPTTNGRRPQALFVLSIPSPRPCPPVQSRQPLFSAFIPVSLSLLLPAVAPGTFDSHSTRNEPRFPTKDAFRSTISESGGGMGKKKETTHHFRDEFLNTTEFLKNDRSDRSYRLSRI